MIRELSTYSNIEEARSIEQGLPAGSYEIRFYMKNSLSSQDIAALRQYLKNEGVAVKNVYQNYERYAHNPGPGYEYAPGYPEHVVLGDEWENFGEYEWQGGYAAHERQYLAVQYIRYESGNTRYPGPPGSPSDSELIISALPVAVIPLIALFGIVGIIGIGIFKFEDLSTGLLKLILAGGAVTAVIIALSRKPAMQYLEKKG